MSCEQVIFVDQAIDASLSSDAVIVEIVRAENRIHGSDQQSCPPGAPPVIITGHVPAVRVPPYHATSRVAAAVPA